MTSPYINTQLESTVTILPSQMNNDIYFHKKNNLIKRLEGKCYKDYGYITKIYEITESGDAVMEPENPMAAAICDVRFSCRLCMPLRGKFIICKVEKMIPMLTRLSNGPIQIIITNNRVNKDNFVIGKNGILIKFDGKYKPLALGDVVKAKIDSRRFDNGGNLIVCMGILDSVASEEEIAMYLSDEYNQEEKPIGYEKYIEQEKLSMSASSESTDL